ncbi:sulfotransferase [Pseudenhygromyxa sp. WMMC2535]|uniref:sulfotransferase family protein n=1 Tax=Pseudenhygromyxa sp. WMMC2535 TaxID=2712867 RepID=UPI001552B644|nr:sulfotransferase [Pseudenhygromyxa sp. WMMC2535]NVB40394.1 sulfotransferase [Pseudenhygromyxa sp. WMMC2535]
MSRLHPNFLICSERSGSNLLRSLLNAHPEIYAPEPIHLGAFWERVEEFGDLRQSASWRALLAAIVEFLAGWKGSLHPSLRLDVASLDAAIPERSFAAIYDHLYALGLAAAGKRRLFIKENHTAQRAPIFRAAYPDASFVYQVRDPRDFLASCKAFPSYKYGSAQAAIEIWCADQQATIELRAQLPAGRVHAGSYEALIHDPEAELVRLCAFLAVDYAPEMLEFYKTEDARRAATHAAWRNLGKPIMTGNAGRYAQTLTRDEIAMVEAHSGALMDRLGYPRSLAAADLPPLPPSAPDARPPHLRHVDEASGSAVVHRIIDRHLP